MSASEGRLTVVGGTRGEGLAARVAQAITRASQYLFATQHARGYWHAPLEANATMEAEYVFFNRLLGRERPDVERRLAERLLALQQADGSWPIYHNGPGGPSTTIEAYFALKLTGMSATEPALVRARDFILGRGGLARAGVFTRIWLAYFGQFPWAGVPSMPVALVLLPPWFPLHAVGFAADHPAMMSGIQGVEDFLVECEGTLMYQPCVSPNWDTALAARALLDAGLDPAHPALGRAAEWLVANQIFRPGDWAVLNPTLEPGGWAFEFANDWYPDVDDSAVILTVLDALPAAETAAGRRAIAYGLNWTLGMQSRTGGWAAFDTNNTAAFLNRIPFADMEAMIDPPTEDVTGRLLHLMGTVGYRPDFGRARRAVEFLRRTQRSDGSWWGRWGVNFVYGTWCALAGLEAIGEDLRAPWIRRAVDRLAAHQNADGGWRAAAAPYGDESLAGQGDSTPSQTAWAVLGLLAADGPSSRAVERGIAWLCRTQGPDGTWDERHFTGTGFPRHFYLRYHLYRHYFPLMALGQLRARLAARGAS